MHEKATHCQSMFANEVGQRFPQLIAKRIGSGGTKEGFGEKSLIRQCLFAAEQHPEKFCGRM